MCVCARYLSFTPTPTPTPTHTYVCTYADGPNDIIVNSPALPTRLVSWLVGNWPIRRVRFQKTKPNPCEKLITGRIFGDDVRLRLRQRLASLFAPTERDQRNFRGATLPSWSCTVLRTCQLRGVSCTTLGCGGYEVEAARARARAKERARARGEAGCKCK